MKRWRVIITILSFAGGMVAILSAHGLSAETASLADGHVKSAGTVPAKDQPLATSH